ncbi:MAG TPA: methylated-DNA--[protein]-cysteine S-methyltransferase [Desulfosporosinus sp.]|nr:methylated-DNA--[protein]-cysteine S-methyltransferase [Desulfosporosinus sp.]
MPTKRDVERILEKRDWKQLNIWAKENKNVYRQLMSRIYVKDGLVFWRAVEALGVFAHTIEQDDQKYALELVRRYFWMLNDESGGTAWNASEAIGSLVAHCPNTCGQFNWMLSGLLEDESLSDGALWGLAQLTQNALHLIEPLEERIRPFLESEEPLTRGLAALIYALMRNSQEAFPLFRENGPIWSVPTDLDQRLKSDQNLIEIYQAGELIKYSVQELWSAQSVYFWTERVTIKDLEVELTVASTEVGLCWLGLGPSIEEEQTLRTWASRWLPKYFLIRKREPNSEAILQLQEYLSEKRKAFTIPFHQLGTPFQRQVWKELLRIPYGETRSYGEIATKIENVKGQRAVGMANHRNPIGVMVPCHRVIGKNGNLTGYAGGLDIKQRLLELEGAILPLISDTTHKEISKKDNTTEDLALFIGVEHIGVKALDMEKTIQFYMKVLGFEFLYRIKPGDVELAFLQLGGSIVELVQAVEGRVYEDGVVNHLAIRVSDISQAIEHLKAQQVELTSSKPTALGEGRYNFFFRGPNGEKLELYQA